MRARMILCLWFVAIGLGPRTLLAQPRKPPLSEEQIKQIQYLVAAFRKAKPMPEQRREVMEKMVTLGPIGLGQLLDILQKEMGRPVSDYRMAFTKAAMAEGVKKLEPVTLMEITKIRQEVLALSKQGEPTKEQIVKVGDPGLARLREMVLFSRQDVLKKHQELTMRREAF